MTADLLELSDRLTAAAITHVAMESTGVYWKPLRNLLEGSFELVLANARHIKAVPGRKTDVRDCEWIADLLRHGLLRGSFVPDRDQRELRELTRYRTSLVRERTAEAVRVPQLPGDDLHAGAVPQTVVRALLHRHAGPRQRLDDRTGLRVGPVQHGDVRERQRAGGDRARVHPPGVQRPVRQPADQLVHRPDDEVRLVTGDERDDRPARILAHLLDQVERVLVVVVDDDDREVGVLADDQVAGTPDGQPSPEQPRTTDLQINPALDNDPFSPASPTAAPSPDQDSSSSSPSGSGWRPVRSTPTP